MNMEGEFTGTEPSSSSSSSPFRNPKSRIPEDTVFYSIFPDSSFTSPPEPPESQTLALKHLHVTILDSLSPFTTHYIWQHQPFNLSISSSPPSPHLHGKIRFGDNLEDEWFLVFLLFEISKRFPTVSIRVFDNDGEFLLIEAAFLLPRWIKPENSANRVFIRRGAIHIIPLNQPASPKVMVDGIVETRGSDRVQEALNRRIAGYPEKARVNMHRVRARVPIDVARVLKHEPELISLAVEGFYDRDIDSMKAAARMERFLRGGEMVDVLIRMSRAMYAQLVQQTFQAPRVYPMPPRSDARVYKEAELGMKIACGFEMVYQERAGYDDNVGGTGSASGNSSAGVGRGSTWDAFRESLESKGYFKGLLPGSKEYRRLMEEALDYYKNGTLFSRTSEVMHAPVRRIDEILSLPHSADDFRGLDLPPSDDDAWLYNGEDELNAAILERQKELETYESEHRNNQKSSKQKGTDHSSAKNLDDFDLGDIAKTMQAFVDKVSSFEGAEVPVNRDSEPVELNVDRFFKDIESVMGNFKQEGKACDGDSTSSSAMDFDESEDGSSQADPFDQEGFGITPMDSYSYALDEELKTTTLQKSFIRANEQSSVNGNKGTAGGSNGMGEDFTPVDVDANLVKSLLDSFSSQQGLPGPASNLLGLMGLHLPQDENKQQ